jgi:hypothetical protein
MSGARRKSNEIGTGSEDASSRSIWQRPRSALISRLAPGRRGKRLVNVGGLVILCGASVCGPAMDAGIAVAPRERTTTQGLDSVQQRAFAIAARIAARHGLELFAPPEDDWYQCFGRSALVVCGKVLDDEVQFRLSEGRASRFSPEAQRVRRELVDSLRTHLDGTIRECDWDFWKEEGHLRSGCPRVVPTGRR